MFVNIRIFNVLNLKYRVCGNNGYEKGHTIYSNVILSAHADLYVLFLTAISGGPKRDTQNGRFSPKKAFHRSLKSVSTYTSIIAIRSRTEVIDIDPPR